MDEFNHSHDKDGNHHHNFKQFPRQFLHTAFCRMKAPGAEAENEPLYLSDFNESRSVYS